MVKFLSEEWIVYGKKFMLEQLDPVKDLNNISTSLLMIIEHVPPNDATMNFYLELKDGNVEEFTVNTDAFVRSDAVFIIRGNYGTYKEILQGTLGTAMAILRNRLTLKGSKMEALKIIKPIDGVIDSLRKITDEFDG
jgi:putative sterol carrier protein